MCRAGVLRNAGDRDEFATLALTEVPHAASALEALRPTARYELTAAWGPFPSLYSAYLGGCPAPNR